MSKHLQLLQSIVLSPWTLVRAHARLLYLHFDPVRQTQSRSGEHLRHRRAHHLFPVFVMLAIAVLGWVVLPYTATGHLIRPFSKQWSSSPDLFSHQFAARPVWAQFDVASLLSIGAVICFFLLLYWSKDNVKKEFEFTFVDDESNDLRRSNDAINPVTYFAVGSRALPEDQSKEACHYYTTTVRRKLRFVIAYFMCCTLTFYYGQIWLNDAFGTDWLRILLWVVLFPPANFYILYMINAPVVFITILRKLFGIRQHALLGDLQSLLRSVQQERLRGHRRRSIFAAYIIIRNNNLTFAQKHIRFVELNHRLMALCAQISAYRPLVGVRLAITVPFNLMIGCYMVYSLLSANLATSHPMYLACVTYVLLVYNTFLLLVVHQCARLERCNRRIESVNRQVACLLLQTVSDHLRDGDRERVHSLAIPHKRLRPYCFHLFGHIRMTNKTYYLIVSYGIAFFMFIYPK